VKAKQQKQQKQKKQKKQKKQIPRTIPKSADVFGVQRQRDVTATALPQPRQGRNKVVHRDSGGRPVLS
jgi:hypothetical protein